MYDQLSFPERQNIPMQAIARPELESMCEQVVSAPQLDLNEEFQENQGTPQGFAQSDEDKRKSLREWTEKLLDIARE